MPQLAVRWAKTATCIAAVFSLNGCERKAISAPTPQPAARAVAVQTAFAKAADLPVTVTLTGTLFGDEQATLSAKVGGRIVQIFADVGDRVGPNAPLAQIDPTDYQLEVTQRELAVTEALSTLGLDKLPDASFDPTTIATIERARFQRENAKAKLDRAGSLMQNNPPPISEQEFADMQTAYEVARRDFDVAVLTAKSQLANARSRDAELQAAKQRLADATVRAPAQPEKAPADHFAVAARLTSVGEYVSAGAALFRVVADRPIKFRGAAPERFADQIKPDQPAVLHVDGAGDVAAKVSRVNPSIDQASRTVEVEIINDNTAGQLRPGGFARATITIGRQTNVTLVPSAALVSFAGVDRVYTIKDGKAAGVHVTPGKKIGDHIAIAETIPADQKLIVGADRGIADGIAVTEAAATTQPQADQGI